jgi:hypothetical protein
VDTGFVSSVSTSTGGVTVLLCLLGWLEPPLQLFLDCEISALAHPGHMPLASLAWAFSLVAVAHNAAGLAWCPCPCAGMLTQVPRADLSSMLCGNGFPRAAGECR